MKKKREEQPKNEGRDELKKQGKSKLEKHLENERTRKPPGK